jgi:hypothetical protein
MNPTFDGETAETWLRGLNSMSDHNAKHILSTFAYFGVPKSMLDVGCGDGTMVRLARLLGVEAHGVDQLVQPDWPPYYHYQNIVDAFRLEKPVAMVICLEVAEHIHETAHGTLMDTLVQNMETGVSAKLIFSAAHPGQDGTGHVAMRPAVYWRRELTDRGLTYNRMDTINLALLWSHIQSPLGHLATNLQVFEK